MYGFLVCGLMRVYTTEEFIQAWAFDFTSFYFHELCLFFFSLSFPRIFAGRPILVIDENTHLFQFMLFINTLVIYLKMENLEVEKIESLIWTFKNSLCYADLRSDFSINM